MAPVQIEQRGKSNFMPRFLVPAREREADGIEPKPEAWILDRAKARWALADPN